MGDLVRRAQSRGEWPGARRTFLDLRWEGGWVDVVGAREVVVGRARVVDAADGRGGGRSEEVGDGDGGARRVGFGGGRGGGGMEVGVGWRVLV